MKITTKYNLGQKIYILYGRDRELSIYVDYLDQVLIDKDGVKYLNRNGYDEIEENEVIPYEDKQKLVQKIDEMLENLKNEQKN